MRRYIYYYRRLHCLKNLLLLSLFFFSGNAAYAQQLSYISGTVVAQPGGRPLPGVSLFLKNSGITTVTDADGRFSLKQVMMPDTLVISYVGYASRQMPINDSTREPLTIGLERRQTRLKEVFVSTGYQEIPRERATGSFTKIDRDLFNRKTGPGILSRLDGIANGVLFDKRDPDNPHIQIRGLSTLSSAIDQPLIVVDNFPYEGDISDINPNDVESVTILKDAAAASIWGAKAGNGVIVISMKKGRFNSPLRVSLNSNVTITGKPDLFNMPQIPSSDYIDLEKYLFDKGAYNSDINSSSHPPLSPVVEILTAERNGEISAAEANARVDALRNLDVRTDFERYIYREAVNQQYAASISGGGTNVSYFFSAGYDKDISNLKGNQFDRVTFRSANTIRPVNNLQLDLELGYVQTNNTYNSPGAYGDNVYRLKTNALPPYAQLADASGNPLSIDTKYRGGYTDTAGAGLLLDWKFRPLQELNNNDKSERTNVLLANLSVKYDLSKYFDVELKYRYQKTFGTLSDYNSTATFFTRDLINQFTQISGNNALYIIPKGGILDLTNNDIEFHAARAQVSYRRQFGNDHQLNAIGGAELRQAHSFSGNYRTYGYDKGNLNVSDVDYINDYPLYTGGHATIPSFHDFEDKTDRFVSLYGNMSYSYKARYTLTLSARKDASNLFGVKTNQKGRPFWSAGIGWKISSEGFYHFDPLPYLNVRVTYGYSGNVNNSISALTTISHRSASGQVTNIPFATVSNVPNPSLRWEKVGTWNVGIDFRSINDRLSGSVEYYRKRSIDVLGVEKVDPTAGTGSILTNSANMKGDGVDVQLNSDNISSSSFKWKTSFLFNYADYKVTRYLLPLNTDGYVSDGSTIVAIEGYNPYMIVSYKWAGLDPETGDPQGIVDGKVSKDWVSIVYHGPFPNQVLSGPALPSLYGGLLNTFIWKGFSLSANITYRLRYYFRESTISYRGLFSNGYGNADFLKRWQNPGDEMHTNVPSMIYPANSTRDIFYQNSEVTVKKGDHIRLEDVRIAYSINPGKKVFHRFSFDRFEIYAYLSNLNFLLWKANRSGVDPDYPSGLKPPHSISVGFKTEF